MLAAKDLKNTIEHYYALLQKADANNVCVKPSPAKWSQQEILGHLIDSAQNNLRRFIVAQYEDVPKIVYQQDDWVRINNYQQSNWKELIQLWYLTNKQIVQVLENTSETIGERNCETGTIHNLNWLAEDYVKHLKHHLHQILQLEVISYP